MALKHSPKELKIDGLEVDDFLGKSYLNLNLVTPGMNIGLILLLLAYCNNFKLEWEE